MRGNRPRRRPVERRGLAAALMAAGLAAGLTTACSGTQAVDGVETRPFHFRDLAKSDVDVITEAHLEATLEHLRTLMAKLYRRNPREWKTSGKPSMEHAVSRTFDNGFEWDFPELGGRRGTECIQLAFDETYEGDRVLAFVAGLTSMILASYEYKTEFYFFDQLDPQKLYNSARNVEIAVWKLSTERDSGGELFLLSNSLEDEQRNLSFERLFGKIIAHQDAMARIVTNKTNRRIKHAIQRALTSAVFLPI